MFRDAIETLKEKWTEDYKLRTGVVVGIVFLGMAAFVFSDSGKDRRDRQVFEEPESIFGISDSVEEMESYEIKGLVDELDERFTQRERCINPAWHLISSLSKASSSLSDKDC